MGMSVKTPAGAGATLGPGGAMGAAAAYEGKEKALSDWLDLSVGCGRLHAKANSEVLRSSWFHRRSWFNLHGAKGTRIRLFIKSSQGMVICT